jgi:hypothetical protein
MLIDLAEGLVKLMAGRQISAGSVVLLTSVTNMAAAGSVGYTMDLIAAIKFLRSNLGDHLEFGALPAFMLNGCSDPATVRTSVETGKWANYYFRDCDVLLRNSNCLAEKLIMDRGDSDRQSVYRCRLRLPSRPANPIEYEDLSFAQMDMPCCVKPMEGEQEMELVATIIDELRVNLAVDLDPAPSGERWPVVAAKASSSDVMSFLVVGSSHASKISAELAKHGHKTELIFEPNWKAFKNSGSILAEKVRERLSETAIDVLVFAVLDNSVFQVLTYSGEVIQARRDLEGSYHIDGELMVMAKSGQYSLFNSLKPLLETAKGKSAVLMSPFPRYVNRGCCEDSEHMPNREDPLAKQQLQDDVRQVAANYRDFLFTASMRYVKVLEPAAVLREMETADSWGDDPIHPTTAAYSRIATSIIRIGDSGTSTPVGSKRPRSNSDVPVLPTDRRRRGGGSDSGGWQPLGEGRFMRYSNQEEGQFDGNYENPEDTGERGGGRYSNRGGGSSGGGGGGGRGG